MVKHVGYLTSKFLDYSGKMAEKRYVLVSLIVTHVEQIVC